MRIGLWCILLFLSTRTAAQNILSNGSFENYTSCPSSTGELYPDCMQWYEYGLGTANIDYFNSCSTGTVGVPNNVWGNETAAQGSAYAGIFTYAPVGGKEYFGTTFAPLHIGTTYEVSMSVSLADVVKYGSNGIGVLFYRNGAPPTISLVNTTPQILYNTISILKNGWYRYTATFVADSAYTHLIIGNFLSNSQIQITNTLTGYLPYSYYYIDSVVVRPLVPFTISYPAATLCAGDTIYVPYHIILNTLNTGNVLTLELSGANGSFSSPVNIGSKTSTTSGIIMGIIPKNTVQGTGYRLRLVSTNNPYTSFDNDYDLDIHSFPAVSASATTPICAGSTLNLSSSSIPGVTYSWSGPSYTSTLQNPTIAHAATGNSGDYIVSATLNGCTAKDSVTVVVKPTPVIQSVNNNSPLCEDSILHLAAQADMGGYSWTGPNNFTSQLQYPQLTNTTVSNSGIYTVIATLNGCSSAPATTTVVVKPMPAVPVATNNSPVCTGGILHLQAGSTTPGVSYDWTGPNGFTSQLQNPDIDPVPAAASGSYNVTATLNGCTSLPGTTVAVVNTVTYLGAYASPNDTICEGDTFNVVMVPVNGGANPSFQWYKNNMEIQGATKLKYTTMTAATGDSFYCKMVAYGVCNTPVTLFSDKIGVTTLPVTPGISVSIASVPARPLPGNPVTFTATITNGGANPQVQWLRNGQDIVGAVNTTWSASNLYPYDKISVRVRSSDPCPEVTEAVSDSIVVNFPASVQELSQGGFNIYPNPNKGAFVVTGDVPNDEPLHITILNQVGQIVYETEVLPRNNNLQAEISISHELPHGVYLLQIKSSSTFAVEKIAVE